MVAAKNRSEEVADQQREYEQFVRDLNRVRERLESGFRRREADRGLA